MHIALDQVGKQSNNTPLSSLDWLKHSLTLKIYISHYY